MSRHQDVPDTQWRILHQLIPEPKRCGDSRWSPLERAPRSPKRNLVYLADRCGLGRPARLYSPYQTCHRRFQQWSRAGVMRTLLEAVAEDLPENRAGRAGGSYRRTLRLDRSAGVSDIHSRGDGEGQSARFFTSTTREETQKTVDLEGESHPDCTRRIELRPCDYRRRSSNRGFAHASALFRG